jgi:hypothetical protein
MPSRRTLQGQMPSMALPMTGSGTSGEMFDDQDPSMQMIESPETRRRRLTPAVGFPEQQPTTIQQLIAMAKGGGYGG